MSYSRQGYSDAPYSEELPQLNGQKGRAIKAPRRKSRVIMEPAPPELPAPSPLYDALSPQSKDKIDRLLLELREVRSMVAAQTLTVDNVGTSDGTESDGS